MLTKKTRDTTVNKQEKCTSALFSKQGIPDWSPMFVLTPARTRRYDAKLTRLI